ncbi:5,10-methylenetetrahydromethanopterin reductase [Halococcoides cellulosivorans]|uniref:5,10-methylenetetrahydromethanopterin reductase n=1 Tax=Halococcoides cellulosivorans TaxID=1679096 RepID=A0A2R4X0A3_9EURY|nr:5,10-methylenetetrahydromethanopterin reductase [Halococcoides cellulosivorans]AWB27219.1 5,10-methylenetetrahydromethanopterin reductase [Halococcoides cellulosivorans]
MIAIEITPDRPIEDCIALATAAEDAGLDAALVSHHYNNRDQWIALSAMATATEAIDLGPGVANPYETHPVTLAGRMATLDEHAGGRGVFGVGAGDRSTLANLGIDRDRPLRRVLETMQVARDLWAGERVTHDGTFVADDAGLNFESGSIPVYVGAQGPHMTRMAGKYADGILYNGAHPRNLAWAAERVAEGRSERDEDRDPPLLAAYASVSIDDDADRARDAAREPVAFITAGAPDPVLDRHGIDTDRAGEIGAAIQQGAFGTAFEAVTPAMVDAFAIAGTPATVEDRLAAFPDAVDGLVAASPLGPDPERAISLLADAVARSGAI